MHLLERYYDHDKNLHLISRGYGSKFSGPFARYRSGVWDVQGFFGDEIELCIDRFPQVEASVGKRRALMVEEASRQNSKSIILMDDALQYWRLEKDFKIISVHGGLLFGNQRIFPSGPMREHPSNLQHANIIVIFNPIQSENFYRDWIGQFVQNPVPIFFIRTRLDCLVDKEGKEYVHGSFEGISAVAACAIAHPEYFFRDLESNSMDLRDKYSFADHHQFTNSEEEMIINAVKRVDADFLVLTEKDKPRWRSTNLPILFARQSLQIANEEDFYLIIDEYVNKKRQ